MAEDAARELPNLPLRTRFGKYAREIIDNLERREAAS
jgi:hypothetical protein